MLTILHGSDVHFGKPHRPSVAAGFLELARRVSPDVVVLAGDLTQRAKVREFEQAQAYLGEFGPAPVVVTPETTTFLSTAYMSVCSLRSGTNRPSYPRNSTPQLGSTEQFWWP